MILRVKTSETVPISPWTIPGYWQKITQTADKRYDGQIEFTIPQNLGLISTTFGSTPYMSTALAKEQARYEIIIRVKLHLVKAITTSINADVIQPAKIKYH